MFEILLIVLIVGGAAVFVWNKLAGTAKGEKSCCEDGGKDCVFKDYITKEGDPGRLDCPAGKKKPESQQ